MLVASALASMRWLLCGGDRTKTKNEICNNRKISRERIDLHYGCNKFKKTALNYSHYRFILIRKTIKSAKRISVIIFAEMVKEARVSAPPWEPTPSCRIAVVRAAISPSLSARSRRETNFRKNSPTLNRPNFLRLTRCALVPSLRLALPCTFHHPKQHAPPRHILHRWDYFRCPSSAGSGLWSSSFGSLPSLALLHLQVLSWLC